MSKKIIGKYRNESTRMPKWDYGWSGYYFITICTQGRECFFGEIIEGKMRLSQIGEIAQTEWLKSPEIRPDMNLKLDEFIIMPNHFHGILFIGRNIYNGFGGGEGGGRDAMHGVPSAENRQPSKKASGPQRNNLSSIIRGFKSAVTIQARQIHADFGWQSRFHDQLIRDERALHNIRKYIRANPEKWAADRLNQNI